MCISNTLWEINYELALLSLESNFVQGLKMENSQKIYSKNM